MSISPIAPIGTIAPLLAPLGAAGATGAGATGGGDFAAQITRGLTALQSTQDKADALGVQAATGSLTDVHQYTIAAAEAALATKLTVAVRNKALEAFNEVMRMQA